AIGSDATFNPFSFWPWDIQAVLFAAAASTAVEPPRGGPAIAPDGLLACTGALGERIAPRRSRRGISFLCSRDGEAPLVGDCDLSASGGGNRQRAVVGAYDAPLDRTHGVADRPMQRRSVDRGEERDVV